MIPRNDQTVCSIVSDTIRGRRVGCIPAQEYKKVEQIYESISRDSPASKRRPCKKDGDLCKLKTSLEHRRGDLFLNNLYKLFYKPSQPREWKECENKKRCSKNWITNHNIYDIMHQYMFTYSNFLFLGVFYIDFMFHDQKNLNGTKCPIDRLNFFELNKSGINVCAMILNTASHGEDGEHWVSMVFFWQGSQGEINFYDSYGNSVISPMPDEIIIYMRMIQKCGQLYGIDFVCQKSKIIHQKKNGECGVYALYFVIHSLENSLDGIEDRIPDEKMSKYRDVFWRTENRIV